MTAPKGKAVKGWGVYTKRGALCLIDWHRGTYGWVKTMAQKYDEARPRSAPHVVKPVSIVVRGKE